MIEWYTLVCMTIPRKPPEKPSKFYLAQVTVFNFPLSEGGNDVLLEGSNVYTKNPPPRNITGNFQWTVTKTSTT
jgi:hypothetical protein